MKVPTDHLFQLIHAMSAAEKRYFKRHYASEKGITTELFDLINSMNSYDETFVKKSFPDSKVHKNLKVYKVQLTDIILKSLISYHSKKSIRSKIRIGLEEIELLMGKQLYSLAQSRIKKVKELCLKYEELEYIFAVLFYEIMISSFFDVQLKNTEYPILEEFETYTDRIKNTYHLKRVNFKLNDHNNNNFTNSISNKEEQRFLKILQKAEKRGEQGELGFNEQYYLNSAYSLIHKLTKNDPQKEYEFKKRNVELFESNAHFIENHSSYFYAALYNYLISCRKLGKYEELENGIEKIKLFTKQYPFLERNLIFVYYLEIKYHYQSKRFNTIIEDLESTVQRHIKKHGQNEASLSALCYIYLAMAHMILSQPQRVQFYLRRLQQLAKKLDPSFGQFFDILELISHYETKDLQIIQNQITSFKRKGKKHNLEHSFYTDMLAFFAALLNKQNYKPQLVKDLEIKMSNITNDGLLNLLSEFILKDWLYAVENEVSLSKAIQSR